MAGANNIQMNVSIVERCTSKVEQDSLPEIRTTEDFMSRCLEIYLRISLPGTKQTIKRVRRGVLINSDITDWFRIALIGNAKYSPFGSPNFNYDGRAEEVFEISKSGIFERVRPI